MTRILLFVLVGYLLLTLLGPLQRILGLQQVVLDIPLLVVIYMVLGARTPALGRFTPRFSLIPGGVDWSGGIAGLALGYVSDVLGGAPGGLHSLVMVLAFLICLWASRHVYLGGTVSMVIVTFFFSALATGLGVSIRWLLGVPPSLATLSLITYQAVLTAAAAPLMLRLFGLIDARLFSDPADRGSLCR